MKAVWRDTVIAESDDTVVVEGNHYFPLRALNRDLVEDSETTTVCPWKGTAHYFHLIVGDARNADAAWYYPEPKQAASQIANRVAFWRGVDVTG